MSKPESDTTAASSEASRLVIAALDRIIAEINDPRVFGGERDGLRMASVILRNTADEMGMKYDR